MGNMIKHCCKHFQRDDHLVQGYILEGSSKERYLANQVLLCKSSRQLVQKLIKYVEKEEESFLFQGGGKAQHT